MPTAPAGVFERGAAFLEGHARLLERRLFDVAFRGADGPPTPCGRCAPTTG